MTESMVERVARAIDEADTDYMDDSLRSETQARAAIEAYEEALAEEDEKESFWRAFLTTFLMGIAGSIRR